MWTTELSGDRRQQFSAHARNYHDFWRLRAGISNGHWNGHGAQLPIVGVLLVSTD
jgi:hypothetical protein